MEKTIRNIKEGQTMNEILKEPYKRQPYKHLKVSLGTHERFTRAKEENNLTVEEFIKKLLVLYEIKKRRYLKDTENTKKIPVVL